MLIKYSFLFKLSVKSGKLSELASYLAPIKIFNLRKR